MQRVEMPPLPKLEVLSHLVPNNKIYYCIAAKDKGALYRLADVLGRSLQSEEFSSLQSEEFFVFLVEASEAGRVIGDIQESCVLPFISSFCGLIPLASCHSEVDISEMLAYTQKMKVMLRLDKYSDGTR